MIISYGAKNHCNFAVITMRSETINTYLLQILLRYSNSNGHARYPEQTEGYAQSNAHNLQDQRRHGVIQIDNNPLRPYASSPRKKALSNKRWRKDYFIDIYLKMLKP